MGYGGEGEGGARVSEILYKGSKSKKKTFWGGLEGGRWRRGGGARVSEFFYLVSTSKFFLRGEVLVGAEGGLRG